MKRISKAIIRLFVKQHKIPIICALGIAVIILYTVLGPRTVAHGNGFSHQIGLFGKCDTISTNCTQNATHRLHSFWGNKDYCEECWELFGQDMFERLSGTKSKSNGIEYDEYKCRRSGCDKRAANSNWEKRFCAEHLQGTTYCRYPHCSEQIPINGMSTYCLKHR